MICISIAPESRKLAKVDLINAARNCDLVELCLDHFIKDPDVGDMLDGLSKPVLVSCRRPEEGGFFKGTDDQRTSLLRQAIVAGPDYVELDIEIAGSIPRFGKTKRVVSFTKLDGELGDIDSLCKDAAAADADIVKFTWPTPDLEAAWPLLSAVSKERELPVVGVGLGRAGLTFSLLAAKYGSPWVYAALEHGMEAHEGEATVWDLDEIYDRKNITKKTRFVGVVGLGKTAATTVRILNAGFQRIELNTRCLPIELGDLTKLTKRLEALKIYAVIVDAKWSEKVLDVAQECDTTTKASRYADLLLKQPDGWHAFNTIWRSSLVAIENTIDTKDPDSRPLDRRNVLVMGATGLSRAIAHGILRRNGILSIAASDDKRAQAIAKSFDVRHVSFAHLYDTLADVVIIADSSIAVGHHKTELNPSYFRPNMTLLDVSNIPHDTEFVRQGRERGSRIIEPRDVYAHQIGGQFKAITGKDLPDDVIASVLDSSDLDDDRPS